MTREEVYRAIDEERAHQLAKWGPMTGNRHEVGAWCEVMRGELEEAAQAWRKLPLGMPALREIVQVAAVAVACLEQHGISVEHLRRLKA